MKNFALKFYDSALLQALDWKFIFCILILSHHQYDIWKRIYWISWYHPDKYKIVLPVVLLKDIALNLYFVIEEGSFPLNRPLIIFFREVTFGCHFIGDENTLATVS